MSNYKKVIWGLILRDGGPVMTETQFNQDTRYISDLVDYYAAHVKIDPKLARDVYDKITTYGIDLEATTDPSSHIGRGFGGTFNDPIRVPYLAGTLVTNDGSRYICALNRDTTVNDFPNILRELIEIDIETALEDGIQTLGRRANHAMADEYHDLAYITAYLVKEAEA